MIGQEDALRRLAEPVVLLRRPADDGGGIDGALAAGQRLEVEDRIVAREGVVAGVVPEGALEPPLRRVHPALEHDLGLRGHLQVHRLAGDHGDARAAEPAREHHLVHAGRQGRRARVDRHGVAAQRDGDLHAAGAALLRHPLVLGRALVDLPVHAERAVVVDLQAVHPHVARLRHRVAREDERERDVAPGVARPAAQHGEGGQARVGRLHDLLARRRAHPLGARLGEVEEVAEPAQLVEERARHAEVEELGHAGGEIVEPLDAEGRRHARGRAEGVDEDGHREALDVLEEEGDVVLARAAWRSRSVISLISRSRETGALTRRSCPVFSRWATNSRRSAKATHATRAGGLPLFMVVELHQPAGEHGKGEARRPPAPPRSASP